MASLRGRRRAVAVEVPRAGWWRFRGGRPPHLAGVWCNSPAVATIDIGSAPRGPPRVHSVGASSTPLPQPFHLLNVDPPRRHASAHPLDISVVQISLLLCLSLHFTSSPISFPSPRAISPSLA